MNSTQSFCGVTTARLLSAERQVSQWPRGQVLRVMIQDTPEEFDGDTWRSIVRAAWALWEAECGIKTEIVTSGFANVLILTREIDQPGGVLAEAELPYAGISSTNTLRVWVDTYERWVNAANPIRGTMDALRVVAHEFGHTLGIGHYQSGFALMAPFVGELREPVEWDIAQAVMRYGEPSETPGGPDGTPLEQCLRTLGCDAAERARINKTWEFYKRLRSGNKARTQAGTSAD